MSNCVFNFNILALVLFGILWGSQIYIRGPCAPRRPSSVKILKRAQVLAYIYISVNFQLRSSIHAGLTQRSLYNWFALKNLPKCGFWGILGGRGSGVTIGWTRWTMSMGPRVPGAPEFQTKKIYIWQHSPNLM